MTTIQGIKGALKATEEFLEKNEDHLVRIEVGDEAEFITTLYKRVPEPPGPDEEKRHELHVVVQAKCVYLEYALVELGQKIARP